MPQLCDDLRPLWLGPSCCIDLFFFTASSNPAPSSMAPWERTSLCHIASHFLLFILSYHNEWCGVLSHSDIPVKMSSRVTPCLSEDGSFHVTNGYSKTSSADSDALRARLMSRTEHRLYCIGQIYEMQAHLPIT